jgi:hypothetical protein
LHSPILNGCEWVFGRLPQAICHHLIPLDPILFE